MATTEGGSAAVSQPGDVQVRRALLSVSDKRGLVDFARGLQELGIEIVSTGGTAEELSTEGIPRRGVEEEEVLESIDIGGPTLIRAAAKNRGFVAVVVSPESYDAVLEELRTSDGRLSERTRESLAVEAFAYTARYDAAVSRWFAEREADFPRQWAGAFEKVLELPYGENPHQ